ncbi:MAG: hypothetical protein M0004_03540 [Actinomycetota bacterium]|nr:hypothetical protein [Actinomycetota bacterium]
MARTRQGGFASRLSFGAERAELVETARLAWRYVLQETVGPLKGLAKRAGLALAGAFVLAVGLVVVMIGVLRVIQGETGGTFSGSLTFVPYLLTAIGALVVLGIAAAIGLGKKKGSSR